MMRNLRILFGVCCLLAILFWVSVATPAQAANSLAEQKTLNVFEPAAIGLSEPFVVSGWLRDANGMPESNKTLTIYLDGEEVGRARTDSTGKFERKFNLDLAAGNYPVVVIYNDAQNQPLSSRTTLVVRPYLLQVQTVPPIAGVEFEINGEVFTSNEGGLASINLESAGTFRLTAQIDKFQSSDKRIEFGRWAEEVYDPFYDIKIPADRVFQVGLDVFHNVGQNFVDLSGDPVASNRISEFTIRSAQGDVFTFSDGQSRWIPASRVARRVNGLEETKLLYSVISVIVDGSNVVNQSQQRFYTEPNANWKISLLLYHMRISVKDGLFGSPIGKSVTLKFPNGEEHLYDLDPLGKVDIQSLARGTYYIEPGGFNGLKNRVPVALSRDQDVETKVISAMDILFVGILGAIVAVGLLFYGRPWLLSLILIRRFPQTNKELSLKIE